jgi:flagellar export protein FliJ
MASFQYRLQPLLDLKIERKKQLELALIQAQKELAAEKEALKELERAQAELEDRLVQSRRSALDPKKGTSGYKLALHTEYVRGLVGDVETAKGAVTAQQTRIGEFEQRVVEARRLLFEAVREVEVLKKHRERLEKRFQKAVERKDALEQNEMGSIIFNQRVRTHESSS